MQIWRTRRISRSNDRKCTIRVFNWCRIMKLKQKKKYDVCTKATQKQRHKNKNEEIRNAITIGTSMQKFR